MKTLLLFSILSFSYHPVPSSNFGYNLPDNRTTAHPGLATTWLRPKSHFTAFYFQDSYANHAAGLHTGRYFLTTPIFRLGWTVGAYIRQTPPDRFIAPHLSFGPAQIIPIAGLFSSLQIPHTPIYLNTTLMGAVNNISIAFNL